MKLNLAKVRLFGFFFHYSSLLTQFSSLITHHLKYSITLHKVCLELALNLSSLNIFQLFVGPIPVTWSEQSCFVTRERFSSPSFSLFSFPLSPFSPIILPKHKLEPIKISQAPSPRRIVTSEQHPSLWRVQWCVLLHRDPVEPTSIKKHDPFPHFFMDDLLRPKTVLPHPFLYSLTLFIYMICVFRIWVFRKLLGFSLNFVCLYFSLLFG